MIDARICSSPPHRILDLLAKISNTPPRGRAPSCGGGEHRAAGGPGVAPETKRFLGGRTADASEAAAEAHADAVLSAAESSADARRDREIAGAGLAWATIVGPAWSAAAAAQAAAAAAAIGWAMAQADADFGIAAAIAGATAGKAGAAAGSIYSAAVSKAAGDLTRALNAVQTGFVDAATAASVKAKEKRCQPPNLGQMRWGAAREPTSTC
ncbi:MAG: hypothetical protein NT171_02055 [Planctomycetota bacterium]|nr:hypothetical protein [Planctomycetota bacterium]